MGDDHVQGTPSPSPPPCSKGCGFFGSPSTMNMCSKCFREHQRSNASEQASSDKTGGEASSSGPQAASAASNGISFNTPVLRPSGAPAEVGNTLSHPSQVASEKSEPKAVALTTAGADPTAPPPRKVQKNTSRCFSCRKKIGLTGFKCRCGYFFCAEHRYSDKHECDFDYQASAREQLKKANPVVVASKLDKI